MTHAKLQWRHALKPISLGVALAALSYQGVAAPSNHTLRVPVPALIVQGSPTEPFFSLDDAALPNAEVGQPYLFDHAPLLKVLRVPDFSASNVAWSGAGVPAGMTLTKTGQLKGVPTARNLQGLVSVTASFGGLSATKGYSLAVLERRLTMAGTTDQGDVDVGAHGTAQLTVTNTGDLEAAPGRPEVFSEPAGLFAVQSTDCAGLLQPMQSCQAEISFNPSAPGVAVGVLSLPQASIPMEDIALKGFGRLVSARFDSPTVPAVSVNSAMEFPVTLRNDGNVAITLDPVALNGLVGEGFSFVESSCPSKLAPGASCDGVLLFNPLKTGEHPGSLTVNTQAGPKTVTFAGQGVVSNISMAPLVGNIGAAQLGSSVTSKLITLTNSGGAPATNLAIRSTDGKFAVTQSTCATSLAANSECTFKVTYTPDEVGVRRAVLTASTSESQATMPMSATGREVSASLQVPGARVTTGYKLTTYFAVTLNNHGSGPLAINGFSFTPGVPEFERAASRDTCKATLAAGASCNFGMAVTGIEKGNTLPVSFNADTDAGNIASGSMTVGVNRTIVTFSPTAVDFGSIRVGESAVSNVVTVTNTGNSGTVVYALPAGVSVFDSSCPASGTNFPVSTKCAMRFQYSPTQAGALNEPGQWTWTGGLDGNTLGFKGLATVPDSAFTADTDFDWLDLGETATKYAVVNNAGSTALDISSRSVTGNSAFALTSGGTCGNSLAVGATCTLAVKFSPTVRGAATASLKVGALPAAAVTGKGAQAILTLNVAEVDFGNAQVDIDSSTRPTRRVLVTNTGDPTSALSRTYPGKGFISAGCLSNLTAATPSCELLLTANPAMIQDKVNQVVTDSVTISAGQAAPVTVTIKMKPVPPSATVTALSFPETQVGGRSQSTVTVKNTGGYRALLPGLSISGNTAEFFINSSTTTCSSSLAVGATCQVGIDFMPLEPGARPAGSVDVNLGSSVIVSAPLNGSGK